MSASFLEHLELSLGDEYRIERELGGGGMSRVFLAEEVALARKVVIKVLTPELAAGVNRERFRREVQLAASLGSHPHIVPLLSAGEANDLLWYTMPFVEGESLRVRLRTGTMTVEQAVPVLEEVASALAFAHRRGVVHRDIKPENILLNEGHAMVADFGVAKALQAATVVNPAITTGGLAVGTPSYMAPEQAAGDEVIDGRADIYALGCVAYEMLSGTPPFTDPSAARLLVAHVSATPTPLATRVPSAPAAIASAIMKCLAKAPADRYATADLFGAALQASVRSSDSHLAAAVLTPTSAARVQALSAGARRRPMLAGLLAAGIAVAAGSYVALGGGRATRTAQAASAPRAVIVADVDNRTADSTLGDLLSEALRAELQQSKVVTPLAPTAIAEELTRMERPPQVRLSGALAREVAQRQGIGAVVEGRVQRVGSSFLLRAAIVSPTDGVEREVAQETAASEDSVVAAVGRLARRMRQALGENPDALAQLKPMEQVTTTSLQALRKYTEAIRAGDAVGGNAASEVALLESAVALDSNFAMAWRRLGVRLINGQLLGLADSTRRVRGVAALRRAYTLRDRLSPVERALTDAAYFTYVERDVRRTVEAYETVLLEQPGNRIALNNLSSQYLQDGRWRELLSVAERSVAVDSMSLAAWSYLGFGQAGTGRAKELDATRRAMLRLFGNGPASADARLSVAETLLGDRQYAAADSLATGVLQSDSLTPTQLASAHRVRLTARQARGQLAAGLAESMALTRTLGTIGVPFYQKVQDRDSLVTALAIRVAYAEDTSTLRTDLPRALDALRVRQLSPMEQASVGLLDLYVAAADGARARALADGVRRSATRTALTNLPVDTTIVYIGALLAERRYAEAVRAIRGYRRPADAWPSPGYNYFLGQAEQALGHLAEAAAAYKAVVNNTDPRRRFLEAGTYELSLRALCRVSDRLGNAADRRQYCGQIAALWQGGDPVLQPQVAAFRALAAR